MGLAEGVRGFLSNTNTEKERKRAIHFHYVELSQIIELESKGGGKESMYFFSNVHT